MGSGPRDQQRLTAGVAPASAQHQILVISMGYANHSASHSGNCSRKGLANGSGNPQVRMQVCSQIAWNLLKQNSSRAPGQAACASIPDAADAVVAHGSGISRSNLSLHERTCQPQLGGNHVLHETEITRFGFASPQPTSNAHSALSLGSAPLWHGSEHELIE